MKTIPDREKANMNVFNAKLQAGTHKGGLDLKARLRMDGVIIDEFRGKSLSRHMVYDLHALMHGGIANRTCPFGQIRFETSQISNATNATPIRISGNYIFDGCQDGDMCWVWG